ncbi:hypothetical protein Ate02nite_96580 [Paractinoplanes tereljensis]|uniref:Sensor-like histidine kinase SenX3 n=1 Tax=Paractinoplanes tereljensis TaxID=571912 RepID=A0A919TXA4_9ACTN|nr:hypothetical protein Ate02nite_96580 [Actinoplanes tereljensis]
MVVVGLTATGLIVSGLRSGQRENAERVMDQRAEMAKSAVLTETARYESLLEATATGLATDSNMTWDDFDAATSSLANAGLKGASSVAFVVPATDAQIPATQARWRSRGADGLVLRPRGTGHEHYFSIFNRGLRSTGTTAGLDVSAARQPAEAMRDARRMSTPTVSDTYVLLRDRNLPAAQQQHSFVFAAPIWPRTADPQFRGWLLLGMRGQDFLSAVLAAVSQGQLNGELLATNTDGSRPVVAHYFVPGTPDMERQSLLDVADREWTLIIRADSGNLPGAHSPLPGLVLGGGIVLTLVIAGLVYVLASARSRAVARVEAATRELRQAERESRRQAVLLAAVMASISDGVGVIDEHGEFILHNPAAREMIGVDHDTSDTTAWQEHYGLFRPDGRTPFPHDELPLVRALRGESSNGVEILIRNPARPEGVLISFDGRPLDPSAGEPGAVAIYHDITELRRYENDLAVFAGVVAHDLKAPLTVIRGHCEELLEDSLQGGGPSHSLLRIVRAVDRMAAMIDTLLAYTTARDAPLNFVRVDLAALTDEVVQDRTGHLAEDAVPEVVVGPLPVVSADPAMLRHVLDNLIGNALKYVRPGAAARVEISADPVGEGWTRVGIADRGIGIPDADKPEVFERFHRAHADAGYAGTGLGLAICKRIVERHGGEIGVADNPGGGTRFHFTLPLEEYAMKIRPSKKEVSTDQADDEAREKLERALAERAAMENTRLPGLSALPSSAPSGGDPAGTRLRSPAPHHHPADAE